MSLVNNQSGVNLPVDLGSALQCYLLPAAINLNTTITGNGSVTSIPIITNGFKNFAFCLQSTQNGSVSIQRYIDEAGTIPAGSAITGALSANTALTVSTAAADNIPCQSMIITVSNTNASAATITNCALLLQAG